MPPAGTCPAGDVAGVWRGVWLGLPAQGLRPGLRTVRKTLDNRLQDRQLVVKRVQSLVREPNPCDCGQLSY